MEKSEGAEVSAEPSGESESSEPIIDSGDGVYQVSDNDLADLGIEGVNTEGTENSSFDFGTQSAEPQIVKDQRLAKEAKSDALEDISLDDAEVSPGKDEVDDWLKPDDDEDGTKIAAKADEEQTHEILRHGEKTNLSTNELRDYAQKGFDYEIRNRELKTEREEFEDLQEQFNTQSQEVQTEFAELKDFKERITTVIEHIRANDPDTFEALTRAEGEADRLYRNPYMENMLTKIEARIDAKLGRVEEDTAVTKSAGLKRDYDDQLADLKDVFQKKFSGLGIKLDEKLIEDEWIDTGDSLKNIFRKLYGDKLLSVVNSKRALARKRGSTRHAPTGARLKASRGARGDMATRTKDMSWSQLANNIVDGSLR